VVSGWDQAALPSRLRSAEPWLLATAGGFHLPITPFAHIRYASDRPGALKGAPNGAAQKTLDGEGRSGTERNERKNLGRFGDPTTVPEDPKIRSPRALVRLDPVP
jgi:hypothetical protein